MTLDLTCPETPISVLIADDDQIPFAVTDQNGDPANITGANFVFRVLPGQYSDTAQKLIEKTLGSGITLTDALTGLGVVAVVASDKAQLRVGTYYYYLHMVEASGNDTTLMRGPYSVAG